ncbi:aspartic peptidase domain-containing protein [Suillus spraguei]|nr:aspartic peptidase domain-containing protein [Suillus spraguei]
MFLAASLFTQALLALSITGSPVEVRNSPITLPLTRRLNLFNRTINLQHDKARVAAPKGRNTHDRRAGISIPVKSSCLDYTVAVNIGSPPTTYNLVVDSGTSITWVGASGTEYVKTATSVKTSWPVQVEYGTDDARSSFSGIIYHDTVSLGDELTVTNFQLGVASISSGFNPHEEGVLGIGPRDLSTGTMPLAMDDTIPTITDYLHDQGKINQHIVGIFFQPVDADPNSQLGKLTFGGTDSTNHVSGITYTPITSRPFSAQFWGINQRITYGQRPILDFTAGVVDTGTTFLYLASDAFERYQAATGATRNQAAGLLTITLSQYRDLVNLDFHIDDQIFGLTPDAQIWPRSLNTKISGGVVGVIYLIVDNLGMPSNGEYDFILGYTFIQRFYTVLDGSRSLVGFAKTQFTEATTNHVLWN